MKVQQLDVFTVPKNLTKDNEENKAGDESDYIEETIGAVGLWQVGVATVASFTRYIAMGNMSSMAFLTPKTDFVCSDFYNNVAIEAENSTCYESCSKYAYNSDVMETSLISHFDLICKNKWLGSFTQTVLMLGVLLGVTLFGWISDRFGRRVALIVSCLLDVISTVASSFAPNYWTFCIMRLITGIATGGCLITCLPLVVEIIGKRHREAAMALNVLPDAISQASLPLYAYFLPKWNDYLMGFSLASVIILFMVCFIPESPRWLISHGKVDQAIESLTRAAKFNKKGTSHIRDKVILSVEAMKIKEHLNDNGSYADFFKTKILAIKTLSNVLMWIAVGTCYYGIYQYLTLLPMNVFMTVAILGIIQIPLCPIEITITKAFNRKTCITVTMLITGLMMMILIFTPKDHWTAILFGVIGFSTNSIAFMVLNLYVAELFPTSMRNMAYGISSIGAKGGSMVAPFIANITPVWIPSVIFGVLSLIGAVSSFVSPETKGNNLKDIIDE